jgi:hypothetical protein
MTTEITPADLARELARLANAAYDDVKTRSHMTCLSNLAAIRPLNQLLIDLMTQLIDIDKMCALSIAESIEVKCDEMQQQLELTGYL